MSLNNVRAVGDDRPWKDEVERELKTLLNIIKYGKISLRSISGSTSSGGGGGGAGADVISATLPAIYDNTTYVIGVDQDEFDRIGNLDYAQFDTTYSGGSTDVGILAWSQEFETFEAKLDPHVTLQFGQEHLVRVKNASGSTPIPIMSVVMFAGATGDTVTVSPAVTDGSVSEDYIVGVTTEEIAADGFGFVTQFGFITGVDTSAYTLGNILYADPSVAGGVTTTQPSAPNLKLPLAAVTRVHAETGRILVRAFVGKKLFELHDVQVTSITDGELLVWNDTSDRWENKTGPEAGLITTSDTGTVTNTMLAGSITNDKLSNSALTVNGTSISLGGSGTVTAEPTGSAGGKLSGTYPNPGLNAALDDLSDVVISGAATDQVIKYNGTSWVNAASPGGGGGSVTSITAGTGLTASPGNPITTSGTLSLANRTVSDKTANYTIVSADQNTIIRSTGSAITITLDNVLSAGQSIEFIQGGTGQITFVSGAGVTLSSIEPGSIFKTSEQYAVVSVICAASGVYYLTGDITADGIPLQLLVIAGGGSGGSAAAANTTPGGGGAGGMFEATSGSYYFNPGQTYSLVIGGGAAGVTPGTTGSLSGNVGSNSTLQFHAINGDTGAKTTKTVYGGGFGGGGSLVGGNGGSGGGGGISGSDTARAGGSVTTAGEGNIGGTTTNASTSRGAGGGGGAFAAGGNGSTASSGTGGNGGNGKASTITGTTYAGGGGGSGNNIQGSGGTGGGTAATESNVNGTNVAANTGSGSGGKRYSSGSQLSGNGGSGVAAIKYPDSYPALTVDPSAAASVAVAGGFRTYTFTASATIGF